MKNLHPKEDQLIGSWQHDGKSVKVDPVSQRIYWLINNILKKVSVDELWNTVYADPNDGRHWVVSYRESGVYGSGAPSLICVTKKPL